MGTHAIDDDSSNGLAALQRGRRVTVYYIMHVAKTTAKTKQYAASS